MYLDHFGLLEAPFSIAPDPRYLYMSERHREALAHLLYGMDSDGAFILLTGDVGTGKTTVSRCLLEQVPDDTNLALVLNPKLNSIELLQVMCDEFRIAYKKTDLTIKALVDYINRYLLGAHAQGKKTVVLIEEAQNLDLDVLEQLRLLTNLETSERKLLQVILLGQPEFLDVLDRPELSQLAQRITARFHLGPLKLGEVEEYVVHRLAIAGCRRPLFQHGVIKQLYHYSGGVPRLINVICDRALLGCYVQNRHYVDKSTLKSAAREVLGEKKAAAVSRKIKPRSYKIAVAFVVVIMLVFTAIYFSNSIWEENSDTDSQVDKSEAEKPQVLSTGQIEKKEKPAGALLSSADGAVQSAINWPDNSQRLRSNLQSYKALFERWGIGYSIVVDGTPCFFAKTRNLSCLHRVSGIEGLRRLNRPAVLTLYDDLDQTQYITLIGLGEKTAQIVMAGETQLIPLKQLKFHWKGEFSLIWRMPAGYQDLIKPGSAGKVVVWLSEKMNAINGGKKVSQDSYYGKKLLEQVKAFQLSKGLRNNGVVGVQTIMHINQVTGPQAPVLEAS